MNDKTIQEYRTDTGLTVVEFCNLTGISHSDYHRIRNSQRELTPLEIAGLKSLPRKRGPKKRSK